MCEEESEKPKETQGSGPKKEDEALAKSVDQ
jgi:hypothetical protein